MVDYTDFKNGLQDANQYLDARHHLSGTTALGNNNLNIVARAEYSFTLRELLCGILSGNGIKLPNLQICLSANIKALLGIPQLQGELFDALSQLDNALNDFMDHTNLNNILGRLNGVLAEAQNVANMINFCSAPVDPIAIPNMLERAFGSFLGAGKNLIDQIGGIAPENVCACIGPGGFNSNVFNGGILGKIANNIDAINVGSLGQSVIDSIRSDIQNVSQGISNLISFENNIKGGYSLGGSQFATPDPNCNSEIGVMHNPFNGSIADNARLVTSMKSLYDRLSGYPVIYRPGTYYGGSQGQEPISASTGGGDPREYANIFELLFDRELLDLLESADDPQSTVDTQIPVRDYCGNIIGYTTNYIQHAQQTSDGTIPTVPNSPGWSAGGLPTSTGNTTENIETVEGGSITVNQGGGTNVYLVNSESAQLALSVSSLDIVVRTDILTVFVRKDTNAFNTGTMSDYQQSSVTFTAFGNSVNELSSYGFVVKDGDTAIARTIIGTANEITVINGNGAGGNPIIGLADNPVIPGNAAFTIPIGNDAQRPVTATSGMLRYNSASNNIEAFFSDTNTWEELATTQDIISQTITIVNVGAGAEVFKQLNSNAEHEFRKITGSGLITVTQNSNDITVNDSLSVSNVGGGTGLFKSRLVNDLQFKTLTNINSNLTITQTADTINIDLPGTRTTTLQTSDGIATTVTFNGSILQPATDRTWFYELYVLAGDGGTTKRAWKLQGVVQNNTGVASLVGAVNRIDYQRGTQDILETPWVSGSSYNQNDVVEHNLIIYTANTNISAGSVSSYTSPDANSDWTVSYLGWNASTDITGTDFLIKVRGDSSTVNWSIKLEFIEL